MKRNETLAIGLMLFALFFGAGNMIFPPSLGQASGTNFWIAISGFLITGVGLPLLGIIAVTMSGGDLQMLSSRIHPKFGILFSTIVYLAIGPFFGIPRTGSVAFEIAIKPFVNEGATFAISRIVFTIFFFGITIWLSLNPSKLVDRIGKILTPMLLTVIIILVGKSFLTPMGQFESPVQSFQEAPFFKGFIEGYLTMDAIAALVFGMVVVTAIKNKGIAKKKELVTISVNAAMIAAFSLALVYISLGYLGATSTEVVGVSTNGVDILAGVSNHLFGISGTILLGIAITLATLTTAIGLVTSVGEYFSQLFPKVPYRIIIFIITFFSAITANVGLTMLIKISLPVLIAIYPIGISLMFLSFLPQRFQGYSEVYIGSIIGVSMISIADGLMQAGLNLDGVASFYQWIPLYSKGVGWILPALLGASFGYFYAKLKERYMNGMDLN